MLLYEFRYCRLRGANSGQGAYTLMSCDPIGVFDSGLGGLTAVKELLHVLPNEDIVYFGDTGRVPYGNRSRETIMKYAKQDAQFLLSKNVKYIIAACGTVSSVAGDLGGCFAVPFTGVVAPTAQAAANATRTGKIGVIGTTATIRSGSYKREIERLDNKIRVYEQDCLLFVPLVENGFIRRDDPIAVMVVKHYLERLKAVGADTIILGCTHYPLLRDVISDVMGENTALIDSGRETALYAAKQLKERGLQNTGQKAGRCSFYVSDTPEGFSHIAGMFLNREIKEDVLRIDIEQYE